MLNQLQGVFSSFQKHDVRYLVIGGIAAILYGVPRATFDLDILIDATPENAQRLLETLLDAGLGTAALITADDLCPDPPPPGP
jgi:tRNA nucleotidyltransferase/poly(A) polymerase